MHLLEGFESVKPLNAPGPSSSLSSSWSSFNHCHQSHDHHHSHHNCCHRLYYHRSTLFNYPPRKEIHCCYKSLKMYKCIFNATPWRLNAHLYIFPGYFPAPCTHLWLLLRISSCRSPIWNNPPLKLHLFLLTNLSGFHNYVSEICFI